MVEKIIKNGITKPKEAISSHLSYAIGYLKSAEFLAALLENKEERESFKEEIGSSRAAIEKWQEIMKNKKTH